MRYNLFKSIITATLGVVALLGWGCEKEADNTAVFPTKVEISCEVGDYPTLEFNVAGDWQLSSNAVWCKFLTPNGDMLDISGRAGDNAITLKITDDGLKDEVTTATITMNLGGQTATIATIVRSGRRLELSIYDTNNKALDAITIGYESWSEVSVKANFRFAATTFPEWVEIEGGSITGTPDEPCLAKLRIAANGDRERYPITKEDGYAITFSNESGSTTFDFPILFEGMGDDKLTFVGPTANLFGWKVSLDGKTFVQSGDQEDVTIENELQYIITARNEDYEIIFIEKCIDRGIPRFEIVPAEQSWMHFDKSRMALTVEPTESLRYGIVLALPRKIYEDIASSMYDSLFELDYSSGINLPTMKYDYQKFTLIEFTQCDLTERGAFEGMYAYHSITTYEIPCTPLNDEALMAEYGVSELFECPFPNTLEGKKPGIIVDPRIENWTTANYDEGIAGAELWYCGNRLKMADNEYYIGENNDEVLAVHLWGPKDGFTSSEPIYVVFTVDGTAKKLLVVTPPTE